MDALKAAVVEAADPGLECSEVAGPGAGLEVAQPEPFTAHCQAGDLLDCLSACTKATSTRSVNPLLTQLELRAEKGWLTVTGTDGELTVRQSAECHCRRPFTVLAPARLMHQTVKQLMGGRSKKAKAQPAILELQQTGKKLALTVTVGGRSLELTAMQEECYPDLPDGVHCLPGRAYLDAPIPELKLPAAAVKHALGMVTWAGVQDSSTGAVHYTNGMLLQEYGNALHLVATDGHRLAYQQLPGLGGQDEITEAQISRYIAGERKGLAEKHSEAVADLDRLVNMTLKQWIVQAPRDCHQRGFQRAIETAQDYVLTYEKLLAEAGDRDKARQTLALLSERGWLLPIRSAEALARMLPKDDEAVFSLYLVNGTMLFHWDETTVATSLLDVKFPPYRRIFPKDWFSKVHVGTEQLADCLCAAHLVAGQRDQNPVVYLKSETTSEPGDLAPDNKLLITADGGEHGQYSERIPAEIDGRDINIAVDPRYILDVLKACDGEQVTITWTSEVSPVMITAPGAPDFIYITMPIRMD